MSTQVDPEMIDPETGADGDVLVLENGVPLWGSAPIKVAVIKDVKPQNTFSGASIAGTQTRTLNTLEDNGIGVSLASNEFTLPPGRYWIEASVPAWGVTRHKAYIYDVTNAAPLLIGSSGYTPASTANNDSTIKGFINLTSARTLSVRHFTTAAVVSRGLGVETNAAGLDEVYTQVTVTRVGEYTFEGVTGEDGALTILNGETVEIAEGSVKQYSSINIASGGTLKITGNLGTWTEIGCSGACVIDGEIIARAGYDGQSTHSGGTFTKTSRFDLGALSYSITQKLGGAGTDGEDGTGNGGNGGAQNAGRGGGGGGGGGSRDIGSSLGGGNGGAGGSSGGSGVSASGGVGGGLGNGSNAGSYGGAAGSGGGGGGVNSDGIDAGGGGGGGYKGHHGKGLVLYVEGAISGSGTINASGRDGFNGGNGLVLGGPDRTGGKGGGGAGGSGGKVVVRYTSGTVPTINVAGGAGGSPGSIGNGTGNAGQAGNAGSSDVATI